MDPLSSMMDVHRARGADLLRCEMRGQWALRVDDDPVVALVVLVRGAAELTHAHGIHRLEAGDVAIVRGPTPFVLGDHTQTPVSIVIEPGNVCRSVTGDHLELAMGLGLRTWGNAGGKPADTVFLSASWNLESQVTSRLVGSLPAVAVVHAGGVENSLTQVLAHEMQRERVGHDVVLDRLADLILISSLRSWFDGEEGQPPSWWRAQSDPVISRALALLHARPEHPFTLESLAREVSVSRATLARRFTAVVGEAPMTYLATWRLGLAADLLRGSDSSVEQVGRAVGYANAFAFSTAFKRAHGSSPRAFRSANTPGNRQPPVAATAST